MKTYYVTKEKLYFIETAKESKHPLTAVTSHTNFQEEFYKEFENLNPIQEKTLLRYLGGDETIEFKVKETLYRLWRIDDVNDKVYMMNNSFGTPSSTMIANNAFTAPLEEIKKWKTPAWEIEEVN